MKTSEEIDQLGKALAEAQAEIENATANAENPHYGSRYADLAAILDIARPALSKRGVAIIQSPESAEKGITVRTRLVHASGQWLETECTLPIEKATPQGAGSAITYARRYALSAALGIAQEDDDGSAGSKPPAPPSSPPRTGKAPAPDGKAPYTPTIRERMKAASARLAEIKAILTDEEIAEIRAAMERDRDPENPKAFLRSAAVAARWEALVAKWAPVEEERQAARRLQAEGVEP